MGSSTQRELEQQRQRQAAALAGEFTKVKERQKEEAKKQKDAETTRENIRLRSNSLLAVCDALIEKLGGATRVSVKVVGEGSNFFYRITPIYPFKIYINGLPATDDKLTPAVSQIRGAEDVPQYIQDAGVRVLLPKQVAALQAQDAARESGVVRKTQSAPASISGSTSGSGQGSPVVARVATKPALLSPAVQRPDPVPQGLAPAWLNKARVRVVAAPRPAPSKPLTAEQCVLQEVKNEIFKPRWNRAGVTLNPRTFFGKVPATIKRLRATFENEHANAIQGGTESQFLLGVKSELDKSLNRYCLTRRNSTRRAYKEMSEKLGKAVPPAPRA